MKYWQCFLCSYLNKIHHSKPIHTCSACNTKYPGVSVLRDKLEAIRLRKLQNTILLTRGIEVFHERARDPTLIPPESWGKHR